MKGFLSPLRINLASEEGQRWGVHPEIADFCRASGGNPSTRCLDLIFLMQVPSSLLGLSLSECTPGHLQHCRTAVLLKTRSCPPLSLARVCSYPEEHRAVCPLPHQQQLVFTRASTFLCLQFGECSQMLSVVMKKTGSVPLISPMTMIFQCSPPPLTIGNRKTTTPCSLLFARLTLKRALFLQGPVQWKAENIWSYHNLNMQALP